ncbi:MAG: DUF4838 domain-containing protein [Ruminococcaceae bacterium]|nr:DUF4838 domain-containing protein [Oscillospiraceae bacterium]
MYQIFKITPHTVVDFAAEELKKYLRMMRPEAGNVRISYDNDEGDGFRLGLMSDLGLDTSDAADLSLDDILYIDVDADGCGVIAGSNPRAVLLATYRYLRALGCRFLLPGVDGEYIPVCELTPIRYRKMADNRVRGWCNEGAEFQQSMLAAIDLAPKLGLNVFMTEFVNPKAYYNSYYDRWKTAKVRLPEPVDADTTLQWKRACECELEKRGLQFHDVGHGWTADPFGIDSSEGWAERDESIIPENARQYLAMVGGRRGFYKGSPLVTQFCMSNPEARRIVARSVADYAENHQNVDFLHVWLADFWNNQCECEVCRQKLPSDWYIALMNDIDDALSARNLPTRIVFICYTETIFAAKDIKLKNPARFSMLFAPITRQYFESVPLVPKRYEKMTYKLNDLRFPDSAGEYLMYGNECRDTYRVSSFVYEYHFTNNQYCNPGNMDYARLIHEDVKAYRRHGYDGIIEDGTQRNFWPNGFPLYVYAETLFDDGADFDEMVADYYRHAYGDVWREVVDFMTDLGKCVSMKYLHGKERIDKTISRLYNPAFTAGLTKLPERIRSFRPFAVAHRNREKRVQTVCMKLLLHYMDFWEGVSPALITASQGRDVRGAALAYHDFYEEFIKTEVEYELYCDFVNLSYTFGDKHFYTCREDVPENPKTVCENDTVGGVPDV